jgi:flavorubredoxin
MLTRRETALFFAIIASAALLIWYVVVAHTSPDHATALAPRVSQQAH